MNENVLGETGHEVEEIVVVDAAFATNVVFDSRSVRFDQTGKSDNDTSSAF